MFTNTRRATKMLIPKFYLASCILEQFGCTPSTVYAPELIDFKNNRNCAVTEDFWLPALLIFTFLRAPGGGCPSPAGSAWVWQLHAGSEDCWKGRTCCSLRSWWRAARCPGSSGDRTLSPGQHFLSLAPQGHAQTKFGDVTHSGFGELCSCLPAPKSGSWCGYSWSWQSFRDDLW